MSFADKLAGYAGTPRVKLPWLKGNRNMLDCAAAVSYVAGIEPRIISCGVLMGYLKGKHAWHTTGIPVKDDIVIMSWSEQKGMGKNEGHDHTGFVQKANSKGVWYTSADSTMPTPGLVTAMHYVTYKQITGYGRIAK
jgi:hypothetical protein